MFPAELYALDQDQPEGLQMHSEISTWTDSEHASFALQYKANIDETDACLLTCRHPSIKNRMNSTEQMDGV